MGLITISLIITDVEYIFMYLFGCLSNFGKISIQVLHPFLIGLSDWFFCFFLLLRCVSSLYTLGINSCEIDALQIFSPIHRLSFSSVDCFFCCSELFSLI